MVDIVEISKEFTFEAAHILDLPYASKCNSLHGHSYVVVLTFEGPVDTNGMVIDYTKMPKELIDEMDHKFLASNFNLGFVAHPATLPICITFMRNNHPHFAVPDSDVFILNGCVSSTAEEIAKFIYNRIKPSFPALESVSVGETAKTLATYSEAV